MAGVQDPGLAGLEKELGCSICTELLYQPLTLLDCLHTFCGSCLKEWFSAQGSRRHSSRISPRFTCPSCRAEVRGTRPNATVTTLLDMVLVAHPDRARSAAEKEEIASRYTHGDSVFPSTQVDESEDDDEDRRTLEEVRELSLRETRAQARREARRAAGHSDRTRERDSNPGRQTDEGRARRRQEGDYERERPSQPDGEMERFRRIEHQSSLRSLLSLSSESETIEEEILRQIIEEGLLDDIDLNDVDPTQEDELAERVADAYRRRHMRQSTSGQTQRQRRSPERGTHQHSRSRSGQRHGEPTIASRDPNDRRPPLSRPHLLEPNTRPNQPNQRRNSEQITRRQTSPVPANPASTSEETLRLTERSSSDMTADHSRSSRTGRVRAESSSARTRRATESQNASDVWMGGVRDRGSSRHTTSQSATNSPSSVTTPPLTTHDSGSTDHPVPTLSSPLAPARADRLARPSSSRSNAPVASNAQYVEPSISCHHCGKDGIQYSLHKRCLKCNGGNYHLCLRCYLSGKGCPQWRGFGSSAKMDFERILASSNQQPWQSQDTGHTFVSLKYERPSDTVQMIMSGDRQATSDNPARRLQSGFFCNVCQSSANECFWKCTSCNEGDWGFCNRCVNQGRCCTHPLLPIRRIAGSPQPSAPTSPADGTTNLSMSLEKESFKILSFSTKCDICTYPIPASVTRFHCLKCNDGDYDVCTNCYLKLVATSKISKENGHHGWRRCVNSHRMIVVGFEDGDDGQRRVIVRDLVGGHALKDEHVNRSPSSSPVTGGPMASPELGSGDWSWKEGQERRKKASRLRGASNNAHNGSPSDTINQSGPLANQPVSPFRRFPPDGGVGLTVHALWSWYPEEAVQDELVFPRGAEIKEVENINDDWFWGCYAGRTGLFPGAHVVVVGEIA